MFAFKGEGKARGCPEIRVIRKYKRHPPLQAAVQTAYDVESVVRARVQDG
jgi:hypothetical protein